MDLIEVMELDKWTLKSFVSKGTLGDVYNTIRENWNIWNRKDKKIKKN